MLSENSDLLANHMLLINGVLKYIIWYIFRFIATLKQKYTQSNGRRPFGASCLITGFDMDGTPHLYVTDPSGTYTEWTVSISLSFIQVIELNNDFLNYIYLYLTMS